MSLMSFEGQDNRSPLLQGEERPNIVIVQGEERPNIVRRRSPPRGPCPPPHLPVFFRAFLAENTLVYKFHGDRSPRRPTAKIRGYPEFSRH